MIATPSAAALWAALAFFTRLPVPAGVAIDEPAVRAASVHAPLVGWLVGAVTGAAYWVAATVLAPELAALVAVASGVWLTGALHEDGLADLCDGLGAHASPERALEIMRDPRSGAFGVLALALSVLVRVLAIAALGTALGPVPTVALLVAAHAISRLACISLIATEGYARAPAAARSSAMLAPIAPGRLARASTLGTLPLLALAALGLGTLALATVPALLAREWLARLMRRRLGGFTGDGLGAVQQASEIAFLLGACALLAVG